MNKRITALLAGALLACASLPALAVTQEEANKAAAKTAQHGPIDIKLIDQAVLKLPQGYTFVPKAEAAQLLDAMGNQSSDDLLGIILPENEKSSWFMELSFEKSGYIKDDDAKDWNADDLLTSLKEGTEDGNKMRKERGIQEFEVLGWVEKPNYRADAHQLVWSANTRNKGAPASEEQGVNYNTYALGREGYVSMNLVTGMNTVEQEKPEVKAMLAALNFNEGKRYQDFNASTDHIAEYGLAALVAGVGAKKLGLLAIMGAFFVKSFKLILLAVAGGFAAIRKFFGGKKEAAE
ncbi:Uncharacterized membrane-anchored protein [Andreprevotia lacus DSM 23236]|jgi:uncharacterized membrane-anchored protein|uniref:Uncharacterized membrane-anchored protein n=1 Tax=Andreprevotia lacus DSM 23236 TaxID=1121001 RepID=A0A1W1XXM8_9NEIS|nr:DUF2167 domain-containing protein [Andreprevotia lacus]SMC28652.1 Uncharacterized membrane-anchored protein [Andreprevotia lacus DSM 23236]